MRRTSFEYEILSIVSLTPDEVKRLVKVCECHCEVLNGARNDVEEGAAAGEIRVSFRQLDRLIKATESHDVFDLHVRLRELMVQMNDEARRINATRETRTGSAAPRRVRSAASTVRATITLRSTSALAS
jgi:hypothetical protein